MIVSFQGFYIVAVWRREILIEISFRESTCSSFTFAPYPILQEIIAVVKAKPFTIEDIVNKTNIRKSKLRWFLREAINVYGARSIFLAAAKKEPVNIGIVAWLGVENDTVDVLVQNDKELVSYELLVETFSVKECDSSVKAVVGAFVDIDALELAIVGDSKWKFIERDCVKLALRLGILSPPEGVAVADMVPHNVEWAAFKDKQERENKKKGGQTQPPVAVHVGQPSEVSPNVDRAKKKKHDGGGFGKASGSAPSLPQPLSDVVGEPSDSEGPPDYMMPDNTPMDYSAADVSFLVTQSPKIQPLSAISEVEMDKDEKNRIRREAIIRCLVDQSVLRILNISLRRIRIGRNGVLTTSVLATNRL
ncbi:hypothetical protein R1sor_020852 [Riccia sorocarpa]|uniref:Uncharacterized protein n=1 Tax=Riccia sorocarpa TaxID=122646 RepID=A0ABD3GH18_9MARC